jgi:virginiamycin A acetyltransferase
MNEGALIAQYGRSERDRAREELPDLLKAESVTLAERKSVARLFGIGGSVTLHFEPPVALPRIEPLLGLIGRYSFAGSGSVLERVSRIGRYCSIAADVVLGRAFHPTTFLSSSKVFYAGAGSTLIGPEFEAFAEAAQSTRLAARLAWNEIERERHPGIEIGHDVWIGDRAIVMQGVTIGTGAVIAANAVVTKAVPPYAIVGGVPAKVLGYRFPPDLIERLLSTRWWDLPLQALAEVPFHRIDEAVAALEAIRASGVQDLAHPCITVEVTPELVTVSRSVQGAPARDPDEASRLLAAFDDAV